tara:strand:- start:831 stop:1493 length:663 start_codon:yes stop_codon:yes gene_type:complete
MDWAAYNLSDWSAGTLELSFEEEAAYRKLCDLIYLFDAALRDDDRANARRLKVSVHKFRKLKSALLDQGKIEVREGYLRQERCEKDLKKIQERSEKAAKKARKRWENSGRKSNEINETSDAAADAVADAAGYANSLTSELVKEEYIYAGQIVRLKAADYQRWKSAYPSISDFDAALQAIDDRLAADPPKNWFTAASAMLNFQHQKTSAKKPSMDWSTFDE